MTITFTIHYHTTWGQVLMLVGSDPALGAWNETEAIYMYSHGDGRWEHQLELNVKAKTPIEYRYFVLDQHSGVKFYEWGENRKVLPFGVGVSDGIVFDNWRLATHVENAMFTSAFTSAIFKRELSAEVMPQVKIKKKHRVVRFELLNSRVEPQHELILIGSPRAFGAWDFEQALPLSDVDFPNWRTEVLVADDEIPFKYKYAIRNKKTKKVILEEYEDRYFAHDKPADLVQVNQEFFKYPRLPWKGAGVAIPVFSLRSKEGLGIGEFLDLKLLVDWAKRTGLKMIQILPINDTVALHNWVDSYPYAAISVFALHPIYLRLQAMGTISSGITNEIVKERQRVLNNKTQIDYEGVMRVKSRYIKLIFDENKDAFLASPEFIEFFAQNQDWLRPYAAFSYLRDLFGSPRFESWDRFSTFTPTLLNELTDPTASHHDDIAIHYFQQYHLHKQLLEVADYARAHQIVLKGDIPIGIYRNSVDAWVSPRLYNMSSQAGAPPDDFTDLGQNWRFPTYNWAEMAKDDYAWWKKRLSKMATYFDAYRIDHILGFFRIWEIPGDQRQGLMGRFNPAWALHRNEIAERGIAFDYERYCTPYIREHMLYPLFGDQTGYARQAYLEETQQGCYRLKAEYNTQVKVEKILALGPDATADEKARTERLRNGLFTLISEVLFFEADFSNGEAFHPRHSLQKTYSFRELDAETQRKLTELYNDYFYRRNENFWRAQAMVKLPAITQATNMLVCGEDLGMVPDCVPDVMNDLGLLSLEVQRMPKNPKIKFGHPAHYPYLSVATPSSHDTSTIRGWWEEDPAESQQFYNEILGKHGASPFYCEPWLVKDIIVQHLYSPSMWAVFPIQDLVGIDANLRLSDANAERINQPANPNHYWRYRFHIPIEDLLLEDDLNSQILGIVKDSGRYTSY